jgi:protein-S-isoprenylcysteine O-methyltransferase Ste14
VRFVLENLALLICSIYATIPCFWFTLHPFTRHWRQRGRRAYRFILPLWTVYIAAAALAVSPWRHATLYNNLLAFIPGAIFVVLGLLLYRASSRGFSHVHLSGLAELEPNRHDQRLVTSGIRSRVRHPIYLGHLCELIGWTIALATIALFALTGFAILTGAIMLRLEDNELEARFGESYREYRRAVPAIMPRLF